MAEWLAVAETLWNVNIHFLLTLSPSTLPIGSFFFPRLT